MGVALSEFLAKQFCLQVQWAYETWQTSKTFFDDRYHPYLDSSNWREVFVRLFEMTKKSYLLDIEKFHDPIVTAGKVTFGLDYVYRMGGWDEKTKGELKGLLDQMNVLHELIRPARNKVHAHCDLEALVDQKALGAFPDGTDITYFEDLKKFAEIIYERTTGGVWAWADHGQNEASEFMDELIAKGVLVHDGRDS